MLAGQLMFDGLAMGLVFVLLATGLVLIASVNRILFMAYGVFYTIGAYTTWWVMNTLHLPYFASLVIAVIAVAVMGMLCQILIFNRLQSKEGGFLATLIASMGLLQVLSQSDLLIFGTVARSIPTVFPGVMHVGGINMPVAKVALIIIGIAVTVGLFLVYERTGFGRAMRTVAFLPEVAALQGINVNRIYILTLGLATAIAGIAGGILAPTYGINPSMGNNILWTVMLMSMLGGMDSLLGAVVGGVVIGQMLSFGQFYIGSSIQIVVFVVIGIVLYFKPNGLLGRGIDIGV
jgi:branched-chain amino acid transport system permease protein